MISLIVVDFKSIEKTCQYIEHFIQNCNTEDTFHYIIVDNCLENNGIIFLKNKYVVKRNDCFYLNNVYFFDFNNSELCYVQAGSNLGFAKGNNLGTEIADKYYKDKYYIISNNDLKLNSKFYWKDYEHIFNTFDDVSIIGPQILGLDGGRQSPYKRVSPFYLLITYQWTRFWPIKSKCDLIDMVQNGYCYRVMGCFMVIRADLFKNVGRFDDNTFMYGEEIILSERMKKNNFRCYYYNDYSVTHEHGTTVKKNASVMQSDKWCFDSLYYYCKNYRNTNKLILILARINRFFNALVVLIKEELKSIAR